MKTANIFVEVYNNKTTGRRAVFKVVNITLEAVKIVLKNEMISLDSVGALEDVENGYLKRDNRTGYYGGKDGYTLTAKGYKAILNILL